jgi:hypothetical protein
MIYLSHDIDRIHYVNEFFEYHEIPTEPILLWNTEINQHVLPSRASGSILIIHHMLFWQILESESSSRQLVEFCNSHNQLWVFGSHDHAIEFTDSKRREKIISLDQKIQRSSILLLLETEMSDRFYLGNLRNTRTLSYMNWHFGGYPRPNAKTLCKKSPQHDYLLTMTRKSRRPHRNILWKELQSRPGLLDRGRASYRHVQNSDTGWIGHSTRRHNWQAGHASMDLYLDCWLEVVPETCYRDLYFFTEKTYKPIMTRTPFLMISTAGYLDWLRSLGFRTFHSLIDERYDRHHRVEDRIRHMVDVLEDIAHTGAQDFYLASQDILDHNFSRLCEIAGAWHWTFDQTMWRALDDFGSRHPLHPTGILAS